MAQNKVIWIKTSEPPRIGTRFNIGRPNKHLQIRTAPDGRKYEWNPTKGFRRWITTEKRT